MGDATPQGNLDEVLARLSMVETENARLAAKLAALEGKAPMAGPEPAPDGAITRRGILRAAGTAAVGGAGLLVAGAALRPNVAAAAPGQNMIIGQVNIGEAATTELKANPGGAGSPVLLIRNTDTGAAIHGFSATAEALYGESTAGGEVAAISGLIKNTNPHAKSVGVAGQNDSVTNSGYGVRGTHKGGGRGVFGESLGGPGVLGASLVGDGVHGESNGTDPQTAGVRGKTTSTTPAPTAAAVRGENRGTTGNGYGVWGTHDGTGVGVFGQVASGTGVRGESTSADGIVAVSGSGTGLNAASTTGRAIIAGSSTKNALYGTSGSDDAIFGEILLATNANTGVTGKTAGNGAGVRGQATGTGVAVKAEGGRAQLWLVPPATGTGAPTTGNHNRGEVYTDSLGAIFQCVVGTGTGVGTWLRVGFNPIDPVRIYDTRPANAPVSHSDTPLGTGEQVLIPIIGVAGVPVGASAVVLNVTAVNPTNTSFLSLYPANQNFTIGSPPTFSNLNTVAGGLPVANLATVKISPLGAPNTGAIRVFHSIGTVDLLLDVAGFYS